MKTKLFLFFILLISACFIFFTGCGGDGGGGGKRASTPLFIPNGGTGDYFDVLIAATTSGSSIRYTTDGSIPTSTTGEIFTGSIPIYRTTTINAIAYAEGMSDSVVATSNIFQLSPITTAVDEIGTVGQYTSIAADGSNVYISYRDGTNDYLKFARSADGGASWLSSSSIDPFVDETGDFGFTSIAAVGSNIYISYYDWDNGDLKFARSADGGASWLSSPLIDPFVDETGDVGAYSSIAVDGSNVYISYYLSSGGDLKFAKSTNGGTTWSTITTIDSTLNVGHYTSIAVDGSNVCISYYDWDNGDLKFARSADGGASWLTSPSIDPVVDETGNVGYYDSIAVDGNNVYISYST